MADHENVLGLRDTAAETSPRRSRGGKSNTRKRPLQEEVSEEVKAEKAEEKAKRAQLLAESRKKLVVSVDMGTTNSGVSYVQSTGKPKDVSTIKNWTGGYNDLCSKVPSVIAYATENKHRNEDVWGYGVKSGDVCCQWWKLLLDGSAEPSDYDDPLLQQSVSEGLMRLPDGKTAQEVATDFLRFLYQHVMRTLESRIGKEALNQTPIVFQCTVPAKWTHGAREATRQAAQQAGIGSRPRDEMVMTDEPEAGAIAAMNQVMASFEHNAFKTGNCVVVVDAGGGTTDLISYKIVKDDPLRLEEACVGEGSKHGGTTIDRNLHSFLEQRFREAFTTLPLKKRGGKSPFMAAFEQCKREFNGKPNQTFELPLKMKMLDRNDDTIKGYDFEEEQVLLTSANMVVFFAPVIQNIQTLIMRQIAGVKKARMSAVKTIVLVGGLGSSCYIQHRLEMWIAKEFKGKIELVTPERPWSAISEGAAIRGLGKPPVQFRRSRDFIGIVVHKPFRPEVHKEEDAYICPNTGKRARNQMEWLVQRGEKITPNTKKTIPCFATVAIGGRTENAIIYQDIYSCTADKGPPRRDESVTKIGRIKVYLTSVIGKERKRIKTAKTSMPTFQNVSVDIVISVGSKKGVLLVTAKHLRTKLGLAQIEFQADPAWKSTLAVGEH